MKKIFPLVLFTVLFCCNVSADDVYEHDVYFDSDVACVNKCLQSVAQKVATYFENDLMKDSLDIFERICGELENDELSLMINWFDLFLKKVDLENRILMLKKSSPKEASILDSEGNLVFVESSIECKKMAQPLIEDLYSIDEELKEYEGFSDLLEQYFDREAFTQKLSENIIGILERKFEEAN